MRKLIFKVRFSPGDILMFTAALRDLHKAYPGEYQTDIRVPSGSEQIFENSPYITRIKDDEADYDLMIQYEMIHESGWNGQHFSEGFRHDLAERLGLIEYIENREADGDMTADERDRIYEYLAQGTQVKERSTLEFVRNLIMAGDIAKPVPSTGIRPDIHLSEEEKEWVNQVDVEFGYKGKYWVINTGWKADFPLKRYPYWQEVADILKADVRLVQAGHKDHHHQSLLGVWSLVGQTDLRQLVRLFYHAEGGLGVVSLPMVLMAAHEKPYVCVAGGREGVRWQIYPDHAFMNSNGFLECCQYDGCWKGKDRDCVNMPGDGIPRCMKLISPEEVAGAVMKYYEGGRLKY